MNKRQIYKTVVEDEVALEHKGLTLCLINNYYGGKHFKKSKWQVDVDHWSVKFSRLYDNIDDAINKFLELKRKIR